MTGVVAVLVAMAIAGVWPADVRFPRTARDSAERGEDRALLARWRLPLTGLAVVAGWTVLGGATGVLVGLAAGVLAWRVLSSVEAPSVTRRRNALERDLPMAVHLLGASLSAGAATVNALADVAASLPGAVAEEFLRIHRRLVLGVDPVTVWSEVDGVLRPLGRSLARAHDSGASVVAAIDRLADELRADGRVRRDALARTVEVRAAAPLGLCFLPAFVLLGVVPMVVGIFASVSLFG
jgi:Flp pilus assembly protein TadB